MSQVVAVVSHPGARASLRDLSSHALTVIGPASDTDDASDVVVTLPRTIAWVERLKALAWRSAAGRNLVRVSPVDRSRLLWRAVRNDPRVLERIRAADVVVAADRDALLTVWKMTRAKRYGSSWAAVYGVPAALFALRPDSSD